MNERQFEAIIEAISIIDNTIKLQLDLKAISREVGISQYHLHRLFKSITGKSLMSYVRARRLSMSLKELLETDRSIIDISNEYQFEYEQSYIRSFKQMFHMTPGQYRKEKCQLSIEQKIDTNYLKYMGEGMLSKPRMCIKPKFMIQGIQSFIVHEKNRDNMDTNKQAELFERVYYPQIKNAVKDVYIGYIEHSENRSYGINYVSGVEVTYMNAMEPPIVSYEIPTCEYAVFRYIGFHSPYQISFSILMKLYHYINTWEKETAYRQAAPFHFERMDMKICSSSYCEMDIYFPIAAKD